MKNTSHIIATCLLLLSSTFFIAISGWDTYLRIALNLIIFIAYFIFFRYELSNLCGKYTDKIIKLKGDLKKFNFEVQVTSSQISSVSESIAVTLEENNVFAKYVYDEVKEMSDNNDKVNSSIDITLSEVRNIMDLLNKAEEITVEMLKKSSLSKGTVKISLEEILQIVKTIDGIHESSNMTLANMERLQKTSKEIARILETVRNVSKQTQLLALNATIESARAGEHGRGFAVVASEIHKLADDTAKSVEDINSLIKAIQNEVESVYTVVRENASRVDEGISATKNIETNLGRIDTSFNDVFGMMDQISALSKKEVHIAESVGTQIKEVEDVISKTSKSVEDVQSSVHQQKHNMEEFASMGSRLNEASSTLAGLFSNEADSIESLGNDALEKAQSSLYIIHEEICSKSGIINLKDSSVHQVILSEFMKKYSFIEAAWTNDHKGRFVCSIPKAGIANANVREWFKQSIKGQDFVSPIYISAITRNPCITVSSPIKNSSGEIVGVVGIDIIIK
ncbi:MAG TPA: methyl-accepting chemotaxis protein [Ruminiclostridium sp.]